MTNCEGALDGIRIIDLSTAILGPWATQTLGDMGADVIKIEAPQGDMTRYAGPSRNLGMSSLFMGSNRNKRSVILDLKTEKGMEALDRLVAEADVLIHNLRPQVSARLKISYKRFSVVNPTLILCEAYGFRKDGPMANNPAYDDIIQAASGLAELQTIVTDQPRYVPTIVADKTASMTTVAAILAALVHRERTGRGQSIEVTMFESMVDNIMVEHLFGATFDPPIAEMGYQRILSTMRKPYRTKDGFLAVLPYSDKNWHDFFRIAGRMNLIDDPRFANHASRISNAEALYELLAEIVAERTTEEWEKDLLAANVPVQAVWSKEDLLDNSHLKATGFWHFRDHPSEGKLRLTDPPIRFSDSPSSIRRLQPRLGEHSRVVLFEAGYSHVEIDSMIKDGTTKE